MVSEKIDKKAQASSPSRSPSRFHPQTFLGVSALVSKKTTRTRQQTILGIPVIFTRKEETLSRSACSGVGPLRGREARGGWA
jgi:hypothetical protein